MPAEQQDVLDAVAELCGALDRCEAELLTARERHEEFKHVAMKEAELAQEREKALREALEQIPKLGLFDKGNGLVEARRIATEALAGSPSEKPGSGQNHPPITSSNPKAKRELADAD